MALDNISEKNLDALFAATYQCLKDNHHELVEIVEALRTSADFKKSAEIQAYNNDEAQTPTDINNSKGLKSKFKLD